MPDPPGKKSARARRTSGKRVVMRTHTLANHWLVCTTNQRSSQIPVFVLGRSPCNGCRCAAE